MSNTTLWNVMLRGAQLKEDEGRSSKTHKTGSMTLRAYSGGIFVFPVDKVEIWLNKGRIASYLPRITRSYRDFASKKTGTCFITKQAIPLAGRVR